MITLPIDTEALIFDCDGTLADTTPMHIEAWHRTLSPIDADCPDSLLDSFRGLPTVEVASRLAAHTGRQLNIKEIAQRKTKIVQQLLPQTKPIAQIAEVAQRYRGELPMSVVSGGTRANVLMTLEAIGMADFFSPVITADDPFPAKPSEVPFLEAAKAMQVLPKNCLVFEDGDLGLLGAVRAGMQYIDVRPIIEHGDSSL